jgi:hypothetical protein
MRLCQNFRYVFIQIIACSFFVAAARGSEDSSCPRPAEFLSNGNVKEYIAKAREYLEKKPQSTSAPMVAYDLVIVAGATRDASLADEMKTRLVLNYSDSLYAYHLITTLPANMGSQGGKSFADLLKQSVKDAKKPFSTEFASKFCRAAYLGLRNIGPGFLSGDELVLDCALMASIAGDFQLKSICAAKKDDLKEESKAIAEVLFDASSDDVAKLLKIHGLKKSESKPLFEQYYYSCLFPAEKESPQVAKVIIETLLSDKKFDEAMPLIEKLLKQQEDPQVLFWQAWCRQARNEPGKAMEILDRLQKKYSQSPWKSTAIELSALIKDRDAILDQHARALLDAIAKILEQGADAIEGTIVYQGEDQPPIFIYLATLSPRNMLEITVMREGKMLLGYKTEQGTSRFYIAGEPSVYQFNAKASYPNLRLNVQRDPDGQLQFGYGVNFGDSYQPFQLSQVLNQPFLTSKDELLFQLKRGEKQGWMPTPVASDEGKKVYRWVCPLPDKPEFESFEFLISPESEICSFKTKSFQITKFHYGPSASFTFSPPSWPAVPVVEKEKSDPSILFRVLSTAMSIFNPQEKKIAAKDAPATRR